MNLRKYNNMQPTYMTHKEHIQEAIKHLDKAIDTFPDKDDKIRRTNDALDGMISTLKIFIGELEY